jgi:hypothetical protein
MRAVRSGKTGARVLVSRCMWVRPRLNKSSSRAGVGHEAQKHSCPRGKAMEEEAYGLES